MTDFIEVYEEALRPELCNEVIEEFEQLHAMGFTYDRKKWEMNPKSRKDDLSLSHVHLLAKQLGNSMEYVMGPVYKAVQEYVKKYEVGMFGTQLTDRYPMLSEACKLQKTSPCQGYHVWHTERQAIAEGDRFLAWMLYLNDVEEGGETEFLYYSKRFKPTTGTLLMWPAGFTHTHRGNPPISGEKYVATGWFRYIK